MNEYLMNLVTEQVNQGTKEIDELSTTQILELINKEDSRVAAAVKEEISQIARAVDRITAALSSGGKMIYFGAGTSGRLGVLDASECPPTYGTDPSLIQAYIAGGDIALRTAVEGSEDIEEDGRNKALECGIVKGDIAVGITASGGAAYVIGALKQAKEMGAITIGVVNNKHTKLESFCDVCIAPVTGPEVVVGSTRMKAGTAQKMVLNMLTTATMIKLGKVYGNMMVDLNASNIKLVDRATRIVKAVTGVEDAAAKEVLEKSNYNSKLAIMMILSGCPSEEAARILQDNNGYLKQALSKVKG